MAWWKHAVFYQIYIRSFADSDGDGMGDMAGITARLPHLAELGVDAVWITPFYPSPQHDHGYDVADYRGVDPLFGTLDDADALLATAHELGIRVIVDLVPNHTSSEHAVVPGRAGRGAGQPRAGPLHLPATAGGDGASRRTTGSRSSAARPGRRSPDGQWYLHLFDTTQPDLDWRNPEVRDDVRGRAALLARPRRRRVPHRRRPRVVQGGRACPTSGSPTRTGAATRPGTMVERRLDDEPMWDQPEVHEIYRPGAGSSTRTPATGWRSARPGPATRSRSPATCGPTSCTSRSTSTG